MEAANFLAKNIRYLRKERKLSQQKLAAVLSVKRSNIAAYETKNVEPRLQLISKIANYFNIDLAELICADLEELHQQKHQAREATIPVSVDPSITDTTAIEVGPPSLDQFKEQSVNVRKMLEGFKVFYQYKQQLGKQAGPEQLQHHSDVENFLLFIDHMLQYNERIIQLFDRLPDASFNLPE